MTNTDSRSPPVDPLLEEAVFGREVEEFIETDRIGQYLIDRARQDLDEATTKLLEVNPTDSAAVAALQLDGRVASRVRGWLREAIENGRQAQVILQQQRDENGV